MIVDGHEDIAWNWLEFGRDPRESVLEARAREAGSAVAAIMGGRTSGLPQWQAGRVGVIFSTIFVMPLVHAYGAFRGQTYSTPGEAQAHALEQLSKYREWAAADPSIRLIGTKGDLEMVIASWARGAVGTVGLVLLMEGADAIVEPAQVREWFDLGLRIVGPAWRATRYAGGTGEPGPLTDLGQHLLAEIAAAGMILDLSHLAEAAYLEAVDSYPGPMIASHSNPRAFLPTDRGLSDEMIKKLAVRGGVIGISPYNRFLKPGWQTSDPRGLVTIQDVAAAIDYVTQLTDSAAHVGIGSDFDGGFGVESIPLEMDSIADLHLIGEALAAKGYGTAEVEAVMGGNWMRVLKEALPEF